MNWYKFIFSAKASHRLQRHFVFWLLWGIYFSLSFFHYQQTGIENVQFEVWNLPFAIKTILLLLIHMSGCYFFIEYLMPHYLFQSRYTLFSTSIFILSVAILIASYFTHKSLFPLVDKVFHYQPVLTSENTWWASVTSGLLSAPKVICAAAAVKLLKRWWLKQKEKEKLEREKLVTDLQLLKAQMHPDFLFSSLSSITRLTEKKNIDNASWSLLKLADILSYMLYESDNNVVPLEKEIRTIKDYLVLEKIKRGDRLEIDIAVKGDSSSKWIVPLSIFPFVENCFAFFGNDKAGNAWLNIEFEIENATLAMKLIYGKTIETPVLPNTDSLQKAIKRLEFFYNGNYELKTTTEPEMMMIHLKLPHKNNTGLTSAIYSNEAITTYANA